MRARAAHRSWPDVGSPGSRPRSFCTCQVLRPRRAARTLRWCVRNVLPSALETASAQTLEPFHADVIAECREQVSVRRYREVGEVAFDHGCEPPPLFVDRLMPVLSQRFLDLPKLGLHPLSLCLAPELEVGAVLLG